MKDFTHLEVPNQENYGASISGNLLAIYAKPRHNVERAKRDKITSFTPSSRANLEKYCRSIPKDRFLVFITLTYKVEPTSPAESKRHLDNFINELKRVKKRSKNVSGLWIQEYQERGVVHYHIWFSHFVKYQWIQAVWNRVSGQEAGTPSTDIKQWKTYTASGLRSYAVKYANKEAQKELPKHIKFSGRWWGKFGDTSTPLAVKVSFNFDMFDNILKEAQKAFKQLKSDFVGLFLLSESQAESMRERLLMMTEPLPS
jgi:hypothetical protein